MLPRSVTYKPRQTIEFYAPLQVQDHPLLHRQRTTGSDDLKTRWKAANHDKKESMAVAKNLGNLTQKWSISS